MMSQPINYSSREKSQPPLARFIPNPKLKFLEPCREVMRFRRLALRRKPAYLESPSC